MKKLKSQLKTVAKSLAALSKQVEKITSQVDKLQPSKIPVAKKQRVAVAKKAAIKKAAPAKPLSLLDTVFNAVKRTRKGITVAQLKEKTRFNDRQISNALYKLSKQGKIVAKARGLYVKK
ncbi:MAG: hypothetical protein ABUJ92_04925 [Desulfobacterales bacterium]